VGHHGVAAAPGVLGVAERVVLGRRLRKPHVAAVAIQLAGLEGFGHVFFDHDGAAGGVDEPCAWKWGGKISLRETVTTKSEGQKVRSKRAALPFFILEIRSLLKRPRVLSCKGQLMVTTSH
jgi:hypothetical protein